MKKTTKTPTDKSLLAAFERARPHSTREFARKNAGKIDDITFFYVMARMSFRDGAYDTSLLQYSIGLPFIMRVRGEEQRRKLFRRYNVDIRTELERLLRSV